jgi:hypothetical protein
VQRDFLALDPAQVGELDRDAGVQERKLAQAMLERREIELGLGERDG